MRSSLSLFLLVAAAASVAEPALAEPSARALVRRLDKTGHAHPLADASGRIPFTAAIPDGVDASSFGLLPVAPGVGAVRLAPSEIDAFAADHPEARLHASLPRRALLDISSGWTLAGLFRNDTGRDGKGVVVGIVDTGIDIAHPDFRDAQGHTRIAWMLASGTPQGVHPTEEHEFGCDDPRGEPCAVFDASDIEEMFGAPSVDVLRDPDGHGTHVSSIAAGNGGAAKKYVGMAPGATLIVAAPEPPGGGFFDGDILNGTRFIFDRADALGLPCVVNLSLGGDYGAHDGTSDLEKGLAALVENHPGRAIVVAAGNSGALNVPCANADCTALEDKGPYGIHTEVHVAAHERMRVPFLAPKAKKGQGFVYLRFGATDEISVGLEGPDGSTWIGPVGKGDDAGYKASDGTTGSVVNDEPSEQSGIVRGSNAAVVSIDGSWAGQSEFAVVLEGRGDADLWVTSAGDVSPDQSIGILFEKAIKDGTVGVPATDPNLIAVGCSINRNSWESVGGLAIELTSFGGASGPPRGDAECFFSGAGPTPTGTPKPEITAPGGFVAAAMAAAADPRTHPGSLFDIPGCPTKAKCYVVDDTHAVAIGTSMSSPHVAGAIALLFEGDPSLTQADLRDALQAGARRPQGAMPLGPQLGAGALDVEGAQESLLNDDGTATAVDTALSWFVLSSSYARTDTTWPVWGTIELRRSTGAIATGISASAVDLDVEGGTVTSALTKVRPGLYRFAVSGDVGGVGDTLQVGVRVQGQSLGVQTLPVGTDAWNTSLDVDGTSGACTCRTANAPRGQGPFALVAALGFAASWRRRRRARAR